MEQTTFKQETSGPKGVQGEYPIINCHTHVFTGDHVPPYLAKSIIIRPFYRLLNFKFVFWIYRKIRAKKGKETFDGTANLKARRKFENEKRFQGRFILYTLYLILGYYLTAQSVDILLHWAFNAPAHPGKLMKTVISLHKFLTDYYILLDVKNTWCQAGIIALVVVFFKAGRNLLWSLAQALFSILRKIPGKKTKELYERYLTIGKYTFHRQQRRTLQDLEKQYPEGTGFVVLPMDMIYMDAGAPTIPYPSQMEDLARIKAENDNVYPFVFADPRRIKEDPAYFSYRVEQGKVVLNDCFIKSYIEGHPVVFKEGKEPRQVKFSGFKIYPALGYYPFDPLLLPLWKYAEQEGLPIMTHCVRGPMYYRGKKKSEWDYHPIFRELREPIGNKEPAEEDFTELLMPQKKNDAFSANFTHPMNYVCLLKKEFLVKAVEIAWAQATDQQTKANLEAMFGFTPATDGNKAHLTNGLDDLKICFGHYGGGDEWYRYLEGDRFRHSTQVISHPDFGIDFIHYAGSKKISLGKPEQLWKFTDWYSIISSMMLQHKNVYADISYILHDDANILPLLKQTLQNPNLREKVLYGTDFFVVRNHKSDKNMLADMMGGLDKADFDQIARLNPRKYLNLPM